MLHDLARAVGPSTSGDRGVQGYAYGAGLSLAIAVGHSHRRARPAQLCEAYIRIGATGGRTPSCCRASSDPAGVAPVVVRDSISGEQAWLFGLADEWADDPPAAAMELARKIAGKNPSAIALTKRAVYETASMAWDDALERSIELALLQHSTVEGTTPQGREKQ